MTTSIETDDFDLPTVAEALQLYEAWRREAPWSHRVGLLFKSMIRLRAATNRFEVACVGSGGWYATTAATSELALPENPLVLFAYRPNGPRWPGNIVVWVTWRGEWKKLDDSRIRLMLHQAVAEQHVQGTGFVAPVLLS